MYKQNNPVFYIAIVSLVAIVAIVTIILSSTSLASQSDVVSSDVCEEVIIKDGSFVCLTEGDLLGSATEYGTCFDVCIKRNDNGWCTAWIKVCDSGGGIKIKL